MKAKDVVDEFCPNEEYIDDISTNKAKVNDTTFQGKTIILKLKICEKLDPEREAKIIWEAIKKENEKKVYF